MPSIHLPVQSGSNKILESMNRRHSIEEYLDVIEKLKHANPEVKFSSDFIIGYPGETEEDFQMTLALLKNVHFINSYSYLYSPRPGTPAFNLTLVNQKLLKKDYIFFNMLQKKLNQNIDKN